MWCWKFSLRSKKRPRNFVFSTTGISVPFRWRTGSWWHFCFLQKCTQTVLLVENLTPFASAQCSNLLRHNCNCLSTVGIFCEEYDMLKSSTYKAASIPDLRHSVMEFILMLNRVGDKTSQPDLEGAIFKETLWTWVCFLSVQAPEDHALFQISRLCHRPFLNQRK